MSNEKPVAILIKDLGINLAAYRLSRNLRQDDVAVQAGVSRGVIARLETGKGGTLDSLIRVLRALGLEKRIFDVVPSAKLNPLDPRDQDNSRQRARPASRVKYDEPWRWGV